MNERKKEKIKRITEQKNEKVKEWKNDRITEWAKLAVRINWIIETNNKQTNKQTNKTTKINTLLADHIPCLWVKQYGLHKGGKFLKKTVILHQWESITW